MHRTTIFLAACLSGCGAPSAADDTPPPETPTGETGGPTPACDATLDIDLSWVPDVHKKDPTQWSHGEIQAQSTAYLNGYGVSRDLLSSCVILDPGEVAFSLGALSCDVASVSLNIVDNCGGGCTTVRAQREGADVALWTNSATRKPEAVSLAPLGGLDTVVVTSLDGNLCGITLQLTDPM